MTRRALITGGQQGIGFGIAQALHAAGFDVVLTSEQPEHAAADALAALPGARYIQHDLSNIAAVKPLLDEVGAITTLVSNAGVPAVRRGDLLDMTPESFDRCMSINLRGAFFLAQEVARRMVVTPCEDYRSLIFVTSVSAEMVSVDRAEYCMSKAGAAMMVQSFATRLAPAGIGVFDLRPGIIQTPMTAPVQGKYDQRIADGLVPSGRWGTPQDIGKIAVPLAEGAFDFATGAVIPAGGGLSIPRL